MATSGGQTHTVRWGKALVAWGGAHGSRETRASPGGAHAERLTPDPEIDDTPTTFETPSGPRVKISGKVSQRGRRAADGIRTHDPELGKPGRGSQTPDGVGYYTP
jgi:hypothetical protein